MMARVVHYHETGPAEVLRVEDVEVPPPAPGEVAIAVEAIGLNRADLLVRAGLHPLTPRFPAQFGFEAAGRVTEVGAGVTGFAPGDAVSVIPRVTMDYGTAAERINVPVRYVEHTPGGLGMNEAAGLWMGALTAIGGLVGAGGLSEGEVVVLPAASSSVGLAAIQVARMVGATPVAVTRGRAKAERLRAAGAELVIVSDEEDVAARVNEFTGGRGAALVYDPIGGPGVAQLVDALGQDGRYVIYGSLSFDPTPFPVAQAFARNLLMRTFALDPARQDLEPAKRMIRVGAENGIIKPVVGATFGLDEIAEACRYMEANEHFGKIVVTT